MNILFVCSRNKWRSRTAETIFKNNGQHQIKSAGTEKSARIKVNQNLLDWADLVFVMEDKHQKRIESRFKVDYKSTELLVLDIPDDYQYMDNDLIEILNIMVNPYL